MHQTVLIVDFGSQVTQLIARRVRELGVYSEIIPCTKANSESIGKIAPKGIILSGGPASVTENNAPKVTPELFDMKIPILGICYGQQTMVQELGGKVDISDIREFGRAKLKLETNCRLFSDQWKIGSEQDVWMSHGDKVTELPKGFSVVGSSPAAPFAVIADENRMFYGVQFHPEVIHTPKGTEMISNFVTGICECDSNWTMSRFKEDTIKQIREEVGNEKVICGLSGGVDSSVTASLVFEAVGDQLTCVIVDTGTMRAGEVKEVVQLFRDNYNIPLIHRDASKLFLDKLSGVTDPEEKRKIIGYNFIEVFEKEAKTIGNAKYLAQGTLYPDVIESISFHGGPSASIKSHHNVGGLPEKMELKLIEPLKELFKDEVRQLGRELDLPASFIERHPFPGPGLAIRIPGEITREKLDILRKADAIFINELKNRDLYQHIWQAFAVLLPVNTVGVMGDARTYEFVCALRAVTSTDGMTADFYHFKMDDLADITNRIINEVEGINRVVYDTTSKPPGTIEWE